MRRITISFLKWAGVLAAVSSTALAQPGNVSAGTTLTTLHSFVGDDGGEPENGTLISDKSGALYGTTAVGGTYGFGTVFKLAPPATTGGAWTEMVLYDFEGGNDGSNPTGALTLDQSGALYGTTVYGGYGSKYGMCVPYNSGCGTVFKLTPPDTPNSTWSESLLYTFTGSDGALPFAGVIFDRFGTLYGTTYLGGDDNSGTVFKLTPSSSANGAWTESVLYSFLSSFDSAVTGPNAPLIFDRAGALYGTTVEGGAYAAGTVFKLTPPNSWNGAWTETVLHTFKGNLMGSDGAAPYGSVSFDGFGALYGTTELGGTGYGTIFKLTPPGRFKFMPSARKNDMWKETVLHNFNGSDGSYPLGGLVIDMHGALYGTTDSGGAGGVGTVFSLMPTFWSGNWKLNVLHSFTVGDGSDPEGDLVFDKSGALYGTTLEGGIGSCSSLGCGTVFEVTGTALAPPFHRCSYPGCRKQEKNVSALALH
jgi:uncharacterized repeat protein (TIGR03803 family)